jgi:hypothetical protein
MTMLLRIFLASLLAFDCVWASEVRVEVLGDRTVSPSTPVEIAIHGRFPAEGLVYSSLIASPASIQVRTCLSGQTTCSCNTGILVEYLNSALWYTIPDAEQSVRLRIRNCGNQLGSIQLTANQKFAANYDLIVECINGIKPCANWTSSPVQIRFDSTFAINSGVSGAWYDPAQSGHGLFIEVLDQNRLLAYWFTFDSAGRQAWFGGVGNYSKNWVEMEFTQTTGGRFSPLFDPRQVVNGRWGTAKLEFTDCNTGQISYSALNSTYGAGSMQLKRLSSLEGHPCQ